MTPARILVLALIALCSVGLLTGAEWVGVSLGRTPVTETIKKGLVTRL